MCARYRGIRFCGCIGNSFDHPRARSIARIFNMHRHSSIREGRMNVSGRIYLNASVGNALDRRRNYFFGESIWRESTITSSYRVGRTRKTCGDACAIAYFCICCTRRTACRAIAGRHSIRYRRACIACVTARFECCIGFTGQTTKMLSCWTSDISTARTTHTPNTTRSAGAHSSNTTRIHSPHAARAARCYASHATHAARAA